MHGTCIKIKQNIKLKFFAWNNYLFVCSFFLFIIQWPSNKILFNFFWLLLEIPGECWWGAGATVSLPEESNGLKVAFWRERLCFIVLRYCLPFVWWYTWPSGNRISLLSLRHVLVGMKLPMFAQHSILCSQYFHWALGWTSKDSWFEFFKKRETSPQLDLHPVLCLMCVPRLVFLYDHDSFTSTFNGLAMGLTKRSVHCMLLVFRGDKLDKAWSLPYSAEI
jgi:hypothetical protein